MGAGLRRLSGPSEPLAKGARRGGRARRGDVRRAGAEPVTRSKAWSPSPRTRQQKIHPAKITKKGPDKSLGTFRRNKNKPRSQRPANTLSSTDRKSTRLNSSH